MNRQVRFVKGHCGWDTLTLVPEGDIEAGQELDAALRILAAPVDGGLEVGFMGHGEQPGEIRLRMVDSTSRTWIPMCGGMTQVIGKALVETFFREHFAVDVSAPLQHFRLLTPSGAMELHVEIDNGKATRVTTVMDRFANYLYELGIETLTLQGCEVLRVGDFCVMDLAALESAHPGVDFSRRDPGRHLEIIHSILRDLRASRHGPELDNGALGMMFDSRPEGPGDFRIYPRFYSDDLAAAKLPYEFQCGTGTVAVAVALAHLKRLPATDGECRVIFEWGSQRSTPDPYGIRLSHVELTLEQGHIRRARFSHSVIEIVAEGKLSIPEYGA